MRVYWLPEGTTWENPFPLPASVATKLTINSALNIYSHVEKHLAPAGQLLQKYLTNHKLNIHL